MSRVGKRRKDLCKRPPDQAVYATFYSASLQADIAEFQEISQHAYSQHCVSPFTLSLADSLAMRVPRRDKIECTYNDDRSMSSKVITTF